MYGRTTDSRDSLELFPSFCIALFTLAEHINDSDAFQIFSHDAFLVAHSETGTPVMMYDRDFSRTQESLSNRLCLIILFLKMQQNPTKQKQQPPLRGGGSRGRGAVSAVAVAAAAAQTSSTTYRTAPFSARSSRRRGIIDSFFKALTIYQKGHDVYLVFRYADCTIIVARMSLA